MNSTENEIKISKENEKLVKELLEKVKNGQKKIKKL